MSPLQKGKWIPFKLPACVYLETINESLLKNWLLCSDGWWIQPKTNVQNTKGHTVLQKGVIVKWVKRKGVSWLNVLHIKSCTAIQDSMDWKGQRYEGKEGE